MPSFFRGFSAAHILTFFARSLRVFSVFSSVGVFFGEQMPAFTTRFACVFSRVSFSPKKVFSLRNRLQMIRVDTPSVSTKVVDHFIFWYSSVMYFIRNTVRQISLVVTPNFGVSSSGQFGRPSPAPIFPFFNFAEKIIGQIFYFSSHNFSPWLIDIIPQEVTYCKNS